MVLQGTLARELLTSPREVLASDGRMLKVRCTVSSFSFSAHADYSQTSEFIDTLAPAHVVLCHGNTNEMDRLKNGLTKQATDQGVKREIHAPANLTDVVIPFIPRRMVHVVGTAAEHPPKVGDKVQGITVQRKAAEAMRVMTPEDLGVYNKVSVGQIIQRQHMALSTSFSKCRLALEVMFEGIDAEQAMGGIEGSGSEDEGNEALMVAGLVKVIHIAADADSKEGEGDGVHGRVVLEWDSGPLSDCVADSVISILLQEQGQPAAIGAAEQQREKAIAEGDAGAVRAADKFIAVELLRTQFGSAEVDDKTGEIVVSIPSNRVVVDWEMDNVTTEPEDAALKGRVLACCSRLRVALRRVDPQEDSSAQDTTTAAVTAE